MIAGVKVLPVHGPSGLKTRRKGGEEAPNGDNLNMTTGVHCLSDTWVNHQRLRVIILRKMQVIVKHYSDDPIALGPYLYLGWAA